MKMKIHIVMKEDARRGNTSPIKCFRNEKQAIEFLKLSVDEIVRNTKLSVLNISDKFKTVYYEGDDYYDYDYKYYIVTKELN